MILHALCLTEPDGKDTLPQRLITYLYKSNLTFISCPHMAFSKPQKKNYTRDKTYNTRDEKKQHYCCFLSYKTFKSVDSLRHTSRTPVS